MVYSRTFFYPLTTFLCIPNSSTFLCIFFSNVLVQIFASGYQMNQMNTKQRLHIRQITLQKLDMTTTSLIWPVAFWIGPKIGSTRNTDGRFDSPLAMEQARMLSNQSPLIHVINRNGEHQLPPKPLKLAKNTSIPLPKALPFPAPRKPSQSLINTPVSPKSTSTPADSPKVIIIIRVVNDFNFFD